MTLSRSRDARTETPDGGAPESYLDVYAVLGVTRDVTPTLARDVYWLQVGRIQDKGSADGDASRRVEELNESLELILDERRRARYDKTYVPSDVASDPGLPLAQPRRLRAGSIVALLLLTVVGAIVAALQSGPLMLGIVVTAGMLSMLAVTALPRRSRRAGAESAFATLHLTPDAGISEVNAAYEAVGQELLSRLRHDRRAIARLERLDRAHSAALRAIAMRDTAAVEGIVTTRRRLLRLIGRAFRALARFILSVLGALALTVILGVMRVGAAMLSLAGRRLRMDAGRLSGLARPDRDEADDEFASVSIDVSRRLAFGRPPVVQEQINDDTDGHAEEQPRSVATLRQPLLNADIVLETDNGNRRVPIPATPLTIGSDPECTLVLPSTLGLAPEHAHVWQRDGTILIHVVTQRPAACLVNDEPMTWASLEDGDVILLGDARFSVRVN